MLFLYNSIVPLIHSCYIFIRYCFLQAIKIYSRKYLNFLQDKGETYHEKEKSGYFDYRRIDTYHDCLWQFQRNCRIRINSGKQTSHPVSVSYTHLLIVRPVPDGYYEIISGHRRKHAAEKLGYRKVPVIIRVLSEDDSILSMVDSNLHRERISYSEKAFAYKLKNDVLKRKSGRKKSQVDHKTPRKRAIEIISEDCGDSPKQVQRYISLTKLIPEMLQKLDDEIISFCPAVEIAALSEKEQRELLVAMEYAQAIPSLSQAQRIRQLSKEKQLSLEKMEEIMCEVKKGEITRVAFTNEQLHKYFPNSYTPAMMKREILALLKMCIRDRTPTI